jgi:uncharacterized integral membrane protein
MTAVAENIDFQYQVLLHISEKVEFHPIMMGRALGAAPTLIEHDKETEMNRWSNLLAWGAVAVVAALAVLNWSTLMAPAPLNLVVAQVEAPLGVVMLGLTTVLVALFFVAYLRNQIGSLLETRKLLKEVQRVHDLADQAEASRIESLHKLISTEFRLLNERLGSVAAVTQPASTDSDGSPLSLTEIVTRSEHS